jgi:two-component system chemotaxis response regulator CheY
MSFHQALRVLIIDDQRAMRSILRGLLRKIGIDDVIEANNGQQALELLTTADDPGIDVILCDLFMGVMDGMTFCQNVRLNTALRKKHIPILILTAERDPFLLSVLREVGVSDIAHKPISASELQPRIEKLIGLNAEPKAQEHGAGSRM